MRRVVAWSLVVALGVTAFLALDLLRATVGRAWVEAPASTHAEGPAVERTVGPGETLWSIAVALRPGEDPRPLVDELVALNGGTELTAGGVVRLPPDEVGARGLR